MQRDQIVLRFPDQLKCLGKPRLSAEEKDD